MLPCSSIHFECPPALLTYAIPASRLPYSVTLLCAHAPVVAQIAVKPAAMMCFTVGSPDHTTDGLADVVVPDPCCVLNAALVYAPKPLRFVFHLWASVSPMENYSEFRSGQNNFSDPVHTRI